MGRIMCLSLDICPEVRRRLPFSFSFAYVVRCVAASRGHDANVSSTVTNGIVKDAS